MKQSEWLGKTDPVSLAHQFHYLRDYARRLPDAHLATFWPVPPSDPAKQVAFAAAETERERRWLHRAVQEKAAGLFDAVPAVRVHRLHGERSGP